MQRKNMMFILVALALALFPISLGSQSAVAQSSDTIVWAFVPSENSQAVLDSAQAIAKLVSDKTGLKITTVVATEYAGAIEAMCSGQAQMASLATFAYVLASSRKCADVGLVAIRNGSTSYKGQIITKADSGIKTIPDLKGKTFCRPDPLSTSGWIIPNITMKANGLNTDADLKVVDVGGHDAVVENVYNGNCDAGATFVDARDNAVKNHPDVKDKVVVIAESLPIPNDTISFVPNFDAKNRDTIVKALLEIAQDKANADLIKKVYNWTGLAEAKDAFFDDFRQQLDAAGVNIQSLVPTKAPATVTAAATGAATGEATMGATSAATATAAK
jgi:phosphonate transport system substrate-binding protein